MIKSLGLLGIFALALAGCGNSIVVQDAADPNAPAAPTTAGIPSDAEVLAEMQRRIQGALSIELSEAGNGEVVWSGQDLTWYYQRGYIIKRPANLDGFADAMLEVGGLSLWVYAGNGWQYQRDLVTWNSYEGIDAPDEFDLLALLVSSDINYMPLTLAGAPENFRMSEAPKFEWHSATSVSFNYLVDAGQIDWPSKELRHSTLTLRTRVYRENADGPWRDPLSPEQIEVEVHSVDKKTDDELRALTL